MANDSMVRRAAVTLAMAAGLALLVIGLSACSSSPAQQAPGASPASEQTPPPAVATAAQAPPAYVPPPAAAITDASPSAAAPQVTSSATASPSPDAEGAARAEEEQKVRAQVAAAKAKADLLSAKADTDCPDLKPGQLRHPGAAAQCAQLRSDAAAAAMDYEALKKEARDAGIAIQ